MRQFLLKVSVAFVLLTVSGCNRPETGSTADHAKTFTVTGILHAINFADRSVTVEHADIPGYMPAMTMPFDVKTMSEVEALKSGDPIRFNLIVTESTSWIEGVKKVARSEVSLPEKAAKRPGGNVSRLKEGDPLPEFKLTDSKNRALTREDFAGKPVLLTFIFTRCPIPNYCPLMSRNLQEIAAEPAAKAVQLLSITIDPEFDTPEVLASYAAQFTQDADRWRFARGTTPETQRLTQAFAVTVQPEAGTLSHGLATALVDGQGTIRQIWRGNGWKPGEVIAAVRAL